MKISVVMVDGGFRENFHVIDSLRHQTFPRADFEVIWVEFYSSINDRLKEKEGVRFVTLSHSPDVEYHSSYCFNEGIRQSKGEVLVIPDADVLVEPTFLESVWKEHQSCDRLAMYLNRFDEPKAAHDAKSSFTLDHLRTHAKFTAPNNFGGCLTVRKKWLLDINGYEQHPIFGSGAHANGYDVNTRLKNLGLHVMWHPHERLYHPWHPGTSAASPRYQLQHKVVEFRASNLMASAFQGMDLSRDSGLPESLRKILSETNGKSAAAGTVFSRFKAKLKRVLASVVPALPRESAQGQSKYWR